MNRDIQSRIKRMVKELCDDKKAEFCRRIGKKDPSAIKDIVGDKGSTPSFNLLYDILSSDLGISPKSFTSSFSTVAATVPTIIAINELNKRNILKKNEGNENESI